MMNTAITLRAQLLFVTEMQFETFGKVDFFSFVFLQIKKKNIKGKRKLFTVFDNVTLKHLRAPRAS